MSIAGCSASCTAEAGYACDEVEVGGDKPGCSRTSCSYVCGDGIALPAEVRSGVCGESLSFQMFVMELIVIPSMLNGAFFI